MHIRLCCRRSGASAKSLQEMCVDWWTGCSRRRRLQPSSSPRSGTSSGSRSRTQPWTREMEVSCSSLPGVRLLTLPRSFIHDAARRSPRPRPCCHAQAVTLHAWSPTPPQVMTTVILARRQRHGWQRRRQQRRPRGSSSTASGCPLTGGRDMTQR
jgi:hypothetical protein